MTRPQRHAPVRHVPCCTGAGRALLPPELAHLADTEPDPAGHPCRFCVPGDDWTANLVRRVTATTPGAVLTLMRAHAGHVIVARTMLPPQARGQGLGSAILRDVCRAADEHGDTLSCFPDRPLPGGRALATAALTHWARRLGFLPNTGRRQDFRISEPMIRPPRHHPPGDR
ncbi:hypothetical protein ACGFJT_37410 [Actinomadura geliboluensis]|uniref:hypothetical protein n=1 Tax=Actinomadura geliboluensis TaxID=882440 RepID=UPI003716D06A